jgi:hypothetical protein
MNDARDVCRPPTISYAEPEHEMHLNRERHAPYRRFGAQNQRLVEAVKPVQIVRFGVRCAQGCRARNVASLQRARDD